MISDAPSLSCLERGGRAVDVETCVGCPWFEDRLRSTRAGVLLCSGASAADAQRAALIWYRVYIAP